MRKSARLVGSTAVVAAIGAGTLLATGATATAGSFSKQRQLQQGPFAVYVGYADNYRKGHPNTPSLWRHSPGVIFKGCNFHHPSRCPKTKSGKDRYDSGAIRIDNLSQTPAISGQGASMTVTRVSVTIGTCTFRPWRKLNVTVPAGETLILAQTGGTPPCNIKNGRFNFDTSDTTHSCTTNDNKLPVVKMTVDGETFSFTDTNQVLNTGGVDPGAKRCGSHNETEDWSPLEIPG